MTGDTNRQWVLASRPRGTPTTDDFELVEGDVPEPGPGEVLVRTRYLSVDPYMRGRMSAGESYAEPWAVGEPMRGGVVGDVVASTHPDFEAGEVVQGRLRWADYGVARGEDLRRVDPERAPVSTALGVLGMPGRTAYFGMLDVAEPRPGDTVLVSAAAGAVGSVAGQVAALAGCRVVGTAGTRQKTDWLTADLGFDDAVNYREVEDLHAAVGEACPGGVDVYFDNVGGPVTDAAFEHLNVRGRVAVCGQIALYNATERPTGPRKLRTLIRTRARVEGFLVGDFEARAAAATEQLAEWVSGGDVAYRETVREGLAAAPEAFLGLFEGANVGKQLVAVHDAAGERR